ncbi:fungal-specific transcription factor domain-containing protein [Mycena alexandri]|uniref:Fungal-specific transcription factor domain-containing protein n=1 Tax=Mycena alexandri TaxID=1745969 RepID=A0AAD6WP63_9AGAR|nr:fungal-specific transcription factor domain-containing protein [Mycena alexandri]
MSSDEDQRDGISVPAKKRRVQRACDMCRRKKRACDGLRMSEKKCTNCIENNLECTFAGAVTKRRGYVDALEARLEMTEQLLRKLTPQNNEGASSSSTHWSNDSPILNYKSDALPSRSPDTAILLASMSIRSMNAPSPPSHGDDLAHIDLVQDLEELALHQASERFLGKSSGAMLVKAAVQLREGYEQKDMPWVSHRMRYWNFDPVKTRVPHVGPFIFPDHDLLSALIDIYFARKNIYFPVLHRPTFERAVADELHTRDESFGAIVLLVCGIGARFSDDPRVLLPGEDTLRCGWQFFDQIPLVLGHLFERPTLYQLQFYCLATIFLEFSAPSAGWTFIGLGLRLAQDVGAHREKHFGKRPTVEAELWKRGFWTLVALDRLVSNSLGRSCAMHHEEFDLAMPIECDDEYWENDDPALVFKQPDGKPSQVTFFRCFLQLNNVLAFALKILYALNKTKRLLSERDPDWEEHIVSELDSALNSWVDSIPAHLRWDPNRRDEVFFDQSAYLYCSYYQVQMTIHRSFIPTLREGAPTSLPSLAICTNAARACSHIAEISLHRRQSMPTPTLITPVFTSGLILLLNVWSGKRTGLAPQMNSAILEVHKCMAMIHVCEKRWQTAGIFWDLLYNLAAIGQFPLPQAVPSTTSASPNTHKRGREDDVAAYPDLTTPSVPHPPYGNVYHPVEPTSATHSAQKQANPLPTYSTDLGQLPIYHQQGDSTNTNNWYSSSELTTSGADPLSMFDLDSAAFNPAARSESVSNLGATGEGMNDDVMAMWANAPMGFEFGDWGSYFNLMTALGGDGST